MKRALALLLAMVFMGFSAPKASALEPFLLDRLQWDQRRIEGEISQSYYLSNNHPVKLNGHVPAKRELDLKIQYRFFDAPALGKAEIFSGVFLATNEDIFDAMKLVIEGGYTFNNLVRLELGLSQFVNIGGSQPGWGGRQRWLGLSGKFLKGDDYLVTGYVRHYLLSNIPAHISNTINSSDPLTAELGFQGFYRPYYLVTFFLSPYLYLNKSYDPSAMGLATSARYHIGKQVKFLPEGVNLEISGDTKLGLDNWHGDTDWSKKNGKGPDFGIQIKAIWEFK